MLQGLVRPEVTLLVLVQGFVLALVVGLVGGAYPAWLGGLQSIALGGRAMSEPTKYDTAAASDPPLRAWPASAGCIPMAT